MPGLMYVAIYSFFPFIYVRVKIGTTYSILPRAVAYNSIKFHNGAHNFIHEVLSLKNLYYIYYVYIDRFMVAIVGYIALTFMINVSINADTSWIGGHFLGLSLKHCSTISLNAAALLVILSRYF